MYLNVPLKLKPTDDILYEDHALTTYNGIKLLRIKLREQYNQ